MGKAQLFDQDIPMILNEIGEDSYYSSDLDLKGKTLSKDTKIREESDEVRAQFFYSVRRPFRKITMPKSINH